MPIGLRYGLAWIPMVALAIANGILRNTTYGRRIPESAAHRWSTLIGAVVLGIYIAGVVRRWPPASPWVFSRAGW